MKFVDRLRSMFSHFDDAFAEMDKACAEMDAELKDAPAEGLEKETVVEEVRPDGTRVTTRTVVRKSRVVVERKERG